MIGGSAAHSILEVGIWVKELGNVELQVSLYRLIIACFFSIYQMIDCAIFSIIMSLGSNFDGLMGFGVFLSISISMLWVISPLSSIVILMSIMGRAIQAILIRVCLSLSLVSSIVIIFLAIIVSYRTRIIICLIWKFRLGKTNLGANIFK